MAKLLNKTQSGSLSDTFVTILQHLWDMVSFALGCKTTTNEIQLIKKPAHYLPRCYPWPPVKRMIIIPPARSGTITIENVLDSKPLVQSGTFRGSGTPPLIFPGQSVSIWFFRS